MYVTRPRSLLKKDPEALSHPPEGPNLGYLVLQDEEAESYCCFGLWKKGIGNLPFPQNKNLTVTYTVHVVGTGTIVLRDEVTFIPVLNQPLSSNLYYVIRRKGKHRGEASICSKEEDLGKCLCFNFIRDIKSAPVNFSDEYQQFEILKKRCGFRAKSSAPDGFPPLFLRRRDWNLCSSTPQRYRLSEALGINPSLREKLPPLTFSSSSSDRSEPVAAGKWYCPFMFVKEEGVSVKEQMKRSVFYEMTLERRWDKVFSKENSENSNEVFVGVVVKTEVAGLGDGREAVWEEGKFGEEYVMWFRSLEGGERKVGLSMATMKRMRWEQESADWVGKNEKKKVRFERMENFDGKSNEWENFEFYVMVESFVLRRMDGSLVLTYDFRHTNHFLSKWK
ncbi:uncharacterized protein LOC114758573 [Neltuma alba]|uniref:uncharacterized protein LOC114758573 n=1 Tax=Neltuma alba TaxID=207710 RepID=UPI0010A434D9|nr:uncharacterized protein LOC114758573 [Prosopis alba]